MAVIGHHELLLIEHHFFTSSLPIISFGSELKPVHFLPCQIKFKIPKTGVEKEEQVKGLERRKAKEYGQG